MKRLSFKKEIDLQRSTLMQELVEALPELSGAEDDRLELALEDGEIAVYCPDEVDESLVEQVVSAHAPDAVPATPVEELNAGIQEATGLGDIKAVFADWSEKYRDRL